MGEMSYLTSLYATEEPIVSAPLLNILAALVFILLHIAYCPIH